MEKQKMDKSKKIMYLLRVVFVVIMAIAIGYFIYKDAPQLIDLLEAGDMEAMELYVKEAGKGGVWVIVVLQVLQTITIFFPGIPIYMCSGIVYGKFIGTLICYITYVVSNTAVFIFHRRMKETAEALLDTSKQGKMAELVQKTAHPAILTGALCMLPVVPNGIVPHISANSKLTTLEFIESVAVGCIPGIFLFVWCGELLFSEYFMVILITLMVVAILMMIIGAVFKEKIANFFEKLFEKWFKNKTTQGAE